MSELSATPGSGEGLRYNSGKLDLSLVPARVFWEVVERSKLPEELKTSACIAIEFFAAVQERNLEYAESLAKEFYCSLGVEDFEAMTRVLEYGLRKYFAWNWTSGMQWSIPIGSGMRHIVLGLLNGQANDPESELPHIGHIACNVLFLHTYLTTYLDGNDMPPEGALDGLRC